jgi:hypothetical protein
LEDAQYEQQKFEAKAKRRNVLLGGTKQYEKELKKNDRRAHRAYLQVKKKVMQRITTIVIAIVITVSIGISMQDTIMNIGNHVMRIDLPELQ